MNDMGRGFLALSIDQRSLQALPQPRAGAGVLPGLAVDVHIAQRQVPYVLEQVGLRDPLEVAVQ